jgi:hypothetical protein
MKNLYRAVFLLSVATMPTLAQDTWAVYDSAKSVTLSGPLRVVDIEDGVVVVVIDVPVDRPGRTTTMAWRIVLETPEALQRAGMSMEAFTHGVLVEVQALTHRSIQLHARAQQVTIRRRTAVLRQN